LNDDNKYNPIIIPPMVDDFASKEIYVQVVVNTNSDNTQTLVFISL